MLSHMIDVTAKLMAMKVGDQVLDPGATARNSRIYATARKLKQRYGGVAFTAKTTELGAVITKIEPQNEPKRYWAGNNYLQTVTEEMERRLGELPIGGSLYEPDGEKSRVYLGRVFQCPDQYVADREDRGWRIYRLA